MQTKVANHAITIKHLRTEADFLLTEMGDVGKKLVAEDPENLGMATLVAQKRTNDVGVAAAYLRGADALEILQEDNVNAN
jgi:hypothetical protein